MANPDELERLAVSLGDGSAYGNASAEEYHEMVFQLSVGAVALLSANRKMRKALEFYADEPAREFPSDGPWGVNSDDFGRVARSALTTQRGDGE